MKVGLNAVGFRRTQSFDRIGAATTARVELSSFVAPTPQLDSVEGSSHSPDGQLAFEGQKKRLATLDALLAEGLVTQEEYAANRRDAFKTSPL